MPLQHIRAAFFDAAGTLFTVNGSVGEIYADLARAHGKDVSPQALEANFRRAFATAPPMAFPNVEPMQLRAREKQWWKDIVQTVFSPLGSFPQFEAYFEALFTHFARPDAWQLYPETRAALAALQARGLYLGVISNFDSRLFRLLDGFAISQFFDPIVISTHAGAAKPDVRIFTRALQRHSLRPTEAIHIGDSLHADITGAQAAGLMPILIDRSRTAEVSPDVCRITSLLDILSVIAPSS